MTGSKRFATMLTVLASTLPLAAAAEGDIIPGTFQIPGTETTLKLYGHAELNATYDFDGRNPDIDNNDWASFVAVQPFDNIGGIEEQRKKHIYLTGRTSRLGLMTNTPTALGPLTVKLEADFNAPNPYQGELTTNGTAFRLRHAYGQLGGLLIGQTWSTFLDLGSTPDTVDFNPAGALALTRQAMVRYTFSFGDASLALAVENPRGLTFSSDYDAIPDFIGNFTYGGSWGHVSARAVAHEYRNVEHSKWAYGAGLSGSVKFANETIVAAVQAGDGIGRYMFNALLQGSFDTGDEIELWRSYGYHIGFTHAWTPQLRSNIIWTQTFFGENESLEAAQRRFAEEVAESTDFVPNRRIDQLFVNTFWSFVKNTEIGLEYTYGRRSTFGPEVGIQHRVNALARFTLY